VYLLSPAVESGGTPLSLILKIPRELFSVSKISHVTLVIGSPPFVLTRIEVMKEIKGEAEFVNTVSTDLYGFEIIGASYDGSIIVSFFFSQEKRITDNKINIDKPRNIFRVFRVLIFIEKKLFVN